MQIFFENEIGHCFATHAWCPLCVFFRAGKCLLEAGGILSLFKYSWTVGLQIVSLGTHGLYYLFPLVGKFLLLEVFLDIGILRLFLDNWIADCLVWKVTNLVKACFTNRLFFLVLL